MLEDIFMAFWVFLPAGLANMVPLIAKRIPFLKKFNQPVDGGLVWRGHRLFGDNKTWRGLISGIVTATLVLWIQQLIVSSSCWMADLTSSVDYLNLPTLIVGPLFAIGALGGDMVESFFKRRVGVKSGDSWLLFDQIDYIIGGVIAILPFIVLSWVQYIWLFVFWIALHLLASFVGWLTGFKKQPI